MGKHTTESYRKVLKAEILSMLKAGYFSQREFARNYCLARTTLQDLIYKDEELNQAYQEYKAAKNTTSGTKTIIVKSDEGTLEEALSESHVDLTEWKVDKYKIDEGRITSIWLTRKKKPVQVLESIYNKIAAGKQVVPNIVRPHIRKSAPKRQLEISLMDLHLGLMCSKGKGDSNYAPEYAGQLMMGLLDELLELSKLYGPYEKVIFPFGHDYLHIDNINKTTTKFTPQPEADEWEDTFEHGETLGLAIVEKLRKIAPVKVISVPGNHGYHSEFALARLIKAYYAGAKAKDVEVDCSHSPYKFHLYGVNLIGFEHGSAIRQQVRLASLMANECRLDGWQQARYCEWHLGDQHRKGSSKPLTFEEQGVSVEYLPGLTAPNRWHRSNSFNWQKRAGIGFVWDKTAGPISRFQVNVDNYSGRIMK